MPLIYTGARNAIDDLIQVYRGAVPGDIASSSRSLDEARAAAEMSALAEGEGAGWAREARLSTSHGIWSDQHAKDRGLGRQANEVDATLKARLRSAPKAVVYDVVYDAVLAVVRAVLPTATIYLVRVPVDVGAFADVDCYCDAGSRVTPTRPRLTIALIPAAANAKTSVLDAMRSKMPVGHLYGVEEF